MAIIAMCNGSYCHAEEILRGIADRLDYNRLDEILAKEVAGRYDVGLEAVRSLLNDDSLDFNKLARKQKKTLTCIEATLAELLLTDNVIVHGPASYLIPGNMPHVLKVCIIANHDYRTNLAVKYDDLTESDAATKIQRYDTWLSQWSGFFAGHASYDERIYDVIVPMHNTSVDQAVDIICSQVAVDAVKTTDRSRHIAEDFFLGAKVKLKLTSAGYDVNVFAENGLISIEINEQTLWMSKLENKLKALALEEPGVNEVITRLGPKSAPPSLNPWDKVDVPPKILLVDDEKEFVHTLSERLKTRNIESSIAYDGEQALEMVSDEVPDVIILDLLMPGIDGIETLRRLKANHLNIQVIILTGHGSDREKETAEELGAFAYLQKPVNINDLARKMKEAYTVSKRGK